MDSLFSMRLIVSANIPATVNCFTFAQRSVYGMLSVNTISSSAESCMRMLAGSDITQCEAMALTDLAPFSFIILAAIVIVPAVSTMSSTITTFMLSLIHI